MSFVLFGFVLFNEFVFSGFRAAFMKLVVCVKDV